MCKSRVVVDTGRLRGEVGWREGGKRERGEGKRERRESESGKRRRWFREQHTLQFLLTVLDKRADMSSPIGVLFTLTALGGTTDTVPSTCLLNTNLAPL